MLVPTAVDAVPRSDSFACVKEPITAAVIRPKFGGRLVVGISKRRRRKEKERKKRKEREGKAVQVQLGGETVRGEGESTRLLCDFSISKALHQEVRWLAPGAVMGALGDADYRVPVCGVCGDV